MICDSATASVSQPATAFHRAGRAFSDLEELCANVERLAEKLVGPIPQKPAAKSDINGSGLFSDLSQSAEMAIDLIDRAQSELARIERVLP